MLDSWNSSQPEITDLLVQHDPKTLARLPVRKSELLAAFAAHGNRQAIRVIHGIPDQDDFLDAAVVDRLMLRVHWEMQRLAEEFVHRARVDELLGTAVRVIRGTGFTKPLRVVDVGCGTGHTVRWLAAKSGLVRDHVEFLGMDLNSTLIREANRLAAAEKLPCRFLHADAFSEEVSGNIFMSTGVIHHFRGEALHKFLQRHEQPQTKAFLHFDFQPWLLAPLGSWFFHILRMRTALARHDGVLSAARAHSAATLTAAARSAAPGLASGIYGAKIWGTPAPRVFQTLVGIRREIVPEFKRQLGRRRSRLGELQ